MADTSKIDVWKNYSGNITTSDTTILTVPTGKRVAITNIRFVNQGTTEIYAEVKVSGSPIFIGTVPPKEGIYDKNSLLELLQGQNLTVSADQAGLKYWFTTVEVDAQ